MASAYVIYELVVVNQSFRLKSPEVKPIELMKEINHNAIDFKDLEITGVGYMRPYPNYPYIQLYCNTFYMEPYLQIGALNAEPVKLKKAISKEMGKPLYFSLKRRSSWTDVLPKYRKYRKEWKKWQAEEKAALESYNVQFDPSKDRYFIYFITFEKRLAFNRLFELLIPTEVRIVFYEKTHVFKEIQPIPGKEYPPEALECMEKINAMYP
jgi:hypothetical protein